MELKKGSYPSYFEKYISLVEEKNLDEALSENWKKVAKFLEEIPIDLGDFAYAPGKWTIKQVICHLIDTERIFAYRALRFGRKDPQLLASYEENEYAANAQLAHRTLADLVAEWDVVRKSSLYLFNNFNYENLMQEGKLPAGNVTVLALGYIICGHAIHHLQVINERYLKKNINN